MAAIASHKTSVSKDAWDGPANEARLRSGETRAYYARAFAWRDPEGDETVKASYRFIHHEVGADGDPGAANMTACSTGIGVLNGGRGGTTIPDSDRFGVHRHLAAHLVAGDMEPPELKAGAVYATRSFELSSLRTVTDGSPRIEGYAAVFDQPAEIDSMLGRYVERIAPGAFAKTLREADVRALLNHNPDWVLGRNRAGTLTLAEDPHGLAVTILPPEATWARDLMGSMARGDINQMSFGFQTVKDRWQFNHNETPDERTLLEVRLFDVSIVTFPAYPQTEASVRAAITALQRYLQPEPEHNRHHSGRQHDEPGHRHHSPEQMRRRIAVLRAALPPQEV